MISRAPDTQRPGVVVIAPFVRVEREHGGEGWIVIAANGHGWLCGDRHHALREKAWHDRQWGRAAAAAAIMRGAP